LNYRALMMSVLIRKCHVRAMQFTCLGRKARVIKAVYKVSCYKADNCDGLGIYRWVVERRL